MTAGRYDILFRQGATFRRELQWHDAAGALMDLSTGYTAIMTVRADYDVDPEIVELTTENGAITLFDNSGTYNILLVLDDSITAAMTPAMFDGKAVYNLDVIQAGVETRILAGYALLEPETTYA